MQGTVRVLAAATALAAVSAFAQTAEVTLTRLDCGTGAKPVAVAERFTDTYAYGQDKLLPFTYSCYVIRHGSDVMVWDTGFVPGSNPNAPKVSLTDQLGQLKITPDQVKFVGISHYHADHTSQLPSLPGAMLLIGKGDWDAITAPKPAQGVNAGAFTNWISGGGKVEPLTAEVTDQARLYYRACEHGSGPACYDLTLPALPPHRIATHRPPAPRMRERYRGSVRAGAGEFEPVRGAATWASCRRFPPRQSKVSLRGHGSRFAGSARS